MLEEISKLVSSFILVISWGYIIVQLMEKKININDIKNILLFLLLIVCSYLAGITNIGFSRTIIIYSTFSICYKYIYKISFKKSLILNFISVMVHFISEIILGIITIILKIDSNVLEKYFQTTPLSGILIFTIIIILWKIFKKTIKKFNKILQRENISNIFYIFLIIFLAILLSININIKTWQSNIFIINSITMIIFLILIIFSLKERVKANKINNEFNNLFLNSQKVSSLLEKYQKINHENKNDLKVIKSKTTDNKEVQEYINLILEEKNIEKQNNWIHEINKINDIGINGFISLKINTMIDNNINIIVNISNNVKKYNFNKLTAKEKKDLCRILGIYLDNAYDACNESERKEITFEMNIKNDNLEIIISNTFNNRINIADIEKYGHTTKGKGHGVGLSLAKDIIVKNNRFYHKCDIIKNYFFQYIYIKPVKSE